MADVHVSIVAEKVASVGAVAINNSMLTGSLVSIVLGIFAVGFYFHLKSSKNRFSRLTMMVEFVVESLFKLTKDIAGEKKAKDFFPLIATAMLFVLFNNWAGLLPGVGTIGVSTTAEEHSSVVETVSVASPSHEETKSEPASQVSDSHQKSEPAFVPLFRAATADLNTTIALALITMTSVQLYGYKYQGMRYFTKFFNFKQGPIFTFVGILELLSDLSKIISFAFRLFGNIFAGEVLLVVISYLLPVIAPLPFLGLEIFVGFVQALVFTMLSLVFINMATIGHDDH